MKLNRNINLVEQNDGWDENKLEMILDHIDTLGNIAYEIRSCVKGAYSHADNYAELAKKIIEVCEALEDEAEYISDYDNEDLEEDCRTICSNYSYDQLKRKEKRIEAYRKYARMKDDEIITESAIDPQAFGRTCVEFNCDPNKLRAELLNKQWEGYKEW